MKLRTAYYLTGTAKSKEKIILCKIFSGSSLLYTASTGLRVKEQHWNKHTMEVKSTGRSSEEINSMLDYIRAKIIKLSMDDTLCEDPARLKTAIASDLSLNMLEKKGFYSALEECIIDKERRLQASSMKVYHVFENKLRAYEERTGDQLSFSYWNMRTMQNFYEFLLNDLNLVNDTATTNIKTLKSFLNWGLLHQQHTNTKYKKFSVSWEKHPPMVLTAEEVQQLESFEPALERLRKVKDVFLISIYTCQRYSDIQQLNSSQIHSGFWNIHSQKTRTILNIPLSMAAVEILSKYDSQLPSISMQKFNKYIKELAELAGITEEVERVTYSGKRRIATRLRKCDLISSHTARRTGISLLISNSAPLPLIQKITGHSKISTLLKYDGTSVNALIPHLNTMTDNTGEDPAV